MSLPLPASAGAPASGLPIVNQALEPAWVRHGSPATQKAYESALAFEDTLVEQLSKSLTAAAGLGGASGEAGAEGDAGQEEGGVAAGGGAVQQELSSTLPQALAAGVMSAGGLGMAAQLTRELEGIQAGAHVRTSGGTVSGGGGAQ